MKDKDKYNFPDADGRYGDFGGKYVSETLMSALEQLETTYENLKDTEQFKNQVQEHRIEASIEDSGGYVDQVAGESDMSDTDSVDADPHV